MVQPGTYVETDSATGARVYKGQRQLLSPSRHTYQAVPLAPDSVKSSAQLNSTADTRQTGARVYKGQRQLLRPSRHTYQAVPLAPDSVKSSAQLNSTADT